MTQEQEHTLRRAVQLAGHGLHPLAVVGLARHYLDVPALSGTAPEPLDVLEDQVERAYHLRSTHLRLDDAVLLHPPQAVTS